MRVVPLESPLKAHQPLYVFDFLISVLNIWNNFKVLTRFMQNWTQPPACSDHGLHRILPSYLLAHCYLMKKSTKAHLYLGLDCGMMEFFTNEPQSKEQLMPLPHLWNMAWAHANHELNKQEDWIQFCTKRLWTLCLLKQSDTLLVELIILAKLSFKASMPDTRVWWFRDSIPQRHPRGKNRDVDKQRRSHVYIHIWRRSVQEPWYDTA